MDLGLMNVVVKFCMCMDFDHIASIKFHGTRGPQYPKQSDRRLTGSTAWFTNLCLFVCLYSHHTANPPEKLRTHTRGAQ